MMSSTNRNVVIMIYLTLWELVRKKEIETHIETAKFSPNTIN